jgi:alkylation response protein AidB-like acyl-CoA dehydrogenase
VVISAEDGKRLVDLDVRAGLRAGGPLTRQDDTWPAVGMDATRSVDVVVQGLSVGAADLVGGPGFYLDRPGFTAGGVGVAAVWLGGAAGVLDALIRTLTSSSTPSNSSDASAHQRAHLGAMAARIAAADALLAELADRLDRRGPDRAGWQLSADDARAARTAVELAVEEVLRRAPRVSGPTPLCRDAGFGHRLADLEVYVRQHHAELDYEQLGSRLLESGELLGRRFG